MRHETLKHVRDSLCSSLLHLHIRQRPLPGIRQAEKPLVVVPRELLSGREGFVNVPDDFDVFAEVPVRVDGVRRDENILPLYRAASGGDLGKKLSVTRKRSSRGKQGRYSRSCWY